MVTCAFTLQALSSSALTNTIEDLTSELNRRHKEKCSKDNSCTVIGPNERLNIASNEFREIARDFLLVYTNTNGHCAFNSHFILNEQLHINDFKRTLKTAIKNNETNPELIGKINRYHDFIYHDVTKENMLGIVRDAGKNLHERFNTLTRNDYFFAFPTRTLTKQPPEIIAFSMGYTTYANESGKRTYNTGHAVTAFVRKFDKDTFKPLKNSNGTSHFVSILQGYKVAIADMNNIDSLIYQVTGVATDYVGVPLIRYEKGFFTPDELKKMDKTMKSIKTEVNVKPSEISNILPFAIETDDPVFSTIMNSVVTVSSDKDTNDNGDHDSTKNYGIRFESVNNPAESVIHEILPLFKINIDDFNEILKLRKELYDMNTNYRIKDTLDAIKTKLYSDKTHAELKKINEDKQKKIEDEMKINELRKKRRDDKKKEKHRGIEESNSVKEVRNKAAMEGEFKHRTNKPRHQSLGGKILGIRNRTKRKRTLKKRNQSRRM